MASTDDEFSLANSIAGFAECLDVLLGYTFDGCAIERVAEYYHALE
jgi:hypothetical protein